MRTMSSRNALALLSLTVAVLAGCQRPRTFAIRAYPLSSDVVLTHPIDGVQAVWACPQPMHEDSVFKRMGPGNGVAATMHRDVDLDCAIDVTAPGYLPVHLPVRRTCSDPHAKSCGEINAVVLLLPQPGGTAAGGAPAAIPLDAPRPGAGSDVQTVLSVVLGADESVSVDGTKLANDEAILPAASKAREATGPDLRAVIKADSAVPHGRVIHVLDLLKQAQVGKIAFGVQPAKPL